MFLNFPVIIYMKNFKLPVILMKEKLVPIFLPKEIVSWFTERGIDYTQLTKDILESYRKLFTKTIL